MKDSSEYNQIILQWMSDSPTAKTIDGQIGSLSGDHLTRPALLTYQRYNVDLEKTVLDKLGFDFNQNKVERLKKMSETGNISDLDRIGLAAGENHVSEAHFPPVFDLPERM